MSLYFPSLPMTLIFQNIYSISLSIGYSSWKENGSVSLKLWYCRKVCCVYQSEPGGTSHNSIAQPYSKSCPPCFLIFPHIVPKSYGDHSWLPMYVNRERYSSSNLTSLPTGTLEIIFPILLHWTLCFVLFCFELFVLTNIFFDKCVYAFYAFLYLQSHKVYIVCMYYIYTVYIHTLYYTVYKVLSEKPQYLILRKALWLDETTIVGLFNGAKD